MPGVYRGLANLCAEFYLQNGDVDEAIGGKGMRTGAWAEASLMHRIRRALTKGVLFTVATATFYLVLIQTTEPSSTTPLTLLH